MNADLNKSLNTLVDTGLSFTRFGLSVAGAAVNYAAEVLKDVSHELKGASERLDPQTRPAEDVVANETPAE